MNINKQTILNVFFIVLGSGNGSYGQPRRVNARAHSWQYWVIAPEFDEDENDGSQFLNLHYHGGEEQDISGEEEENVEEAEV